MGSLNGLSGLSGIDGLTGGGVITYTQKVISYSPIAYWVQGEAAGLVATDEILSPQQDGTYVGVTLGQPGIGDGNTCPLFDGANDYNNVGTVTFIGRFNSSEGSAMAWGRVLNAGVWADGQTRNLVSLEVNAQNRVYLRKVAGTLQWVYEANNVFRQVSLATVTTDWFQMVITWSISAGVNGEMRAYFNGAQTGVTQTNLGVWAGALTPGRTNVGAARSTPANVWDGYAAHAPVWDTAIPLATVVDLYTL